MELIVIPPKVAVQFRVSVIYDLLTTLGLIYNAQRFEGLSDWVRQAEARLQPEDSKLLDPLGMCMLFATGIQSFLVDQIPDTEDTVFETMWSHLEAISATQLQKAIQAAIWEHLLDIDVVNKTMSFPDSSNRLVVLLQEAQHHHEKHWAEPPTPPMFLKAFADMVMDAELFRETVLAGIWHLWHEIYHEQACEDREQLQTAVDFHTTQNYQSDFANVFRAVTGRTLPDRLSKRLNSVRQVEMIPSCHIGAYITVSIFGERARIGFNANLAPSDHSTTSIAELYPALKALADETRLKMVRLLATHELNVGEIAETLHLTQSTASRHLTLLAKTDLLHTRREGAMRYYSLNPQAIQEISKRLRELS